MTQPHASRGASLPSRRSRRRRLALTLVLPAGLLAVALLATGQGWLRRETPPVPSAPVATVMAPTVKVAAPSGAYRPLLDPRFALGPAPAAIGLHAPLGAAFVSAVPPAPMQLAEAVPEPLVTGSLPPASAAAPTPPDRAAGLVAAPMPVARPLQLTLPKTPEAPAVAERRVSPRLRAAAAPKPAEDNRSFFEKLFGVTREPTTALAYAAPQDEVVDSGRGFRLSPRSSATPSTSRQTAIYDISARTVYLPNGERLEAHSGLGEMMDDVRYAHVRMRGVTPPHVYNLVEREALFHGVRAIRLHPVGGSGAIHGRAGLLAHTYLLGPRGDSNGCVSIKDYDRFLKAYLDGQIRRLVVVAKLD